MEILTQIGLFHYLFLSICLFLIGFWGVIISKNLIKILICIEFMMNAVGINLIAFSVYKTPVELSGEVFTLFLMAISAVQVAIGLSIIIMLFRCKKTINVEKYEDLKG